jgi:hypothetical protein
MIAVATILGCFFVGTPASAQNDSCMSLTMLIQGKLQPPPIGWHGTVKGLLVDKDHKVRPLEGALARAPFKDGMPPVYTGQVGHETFHFSFDFGTTAGKFAGLLDHEIAQFSPSVTPHLDFSKGPPPFALGTTRSTFKVAPQTADGWTSSGWFEKATGNLLAVATFLVNSTPTSFPDPEFPTGGPIIGYWNVEVTGKLCNVEVK